MNLSNRRGRRLRVIIIAIGLLLALPLSVLIYQSVIVRRDQAGDDRPKDVVVSNVTNEAAVISWVSNPNPVIGSVKYTFTQAELDTASARLAQDDRDIKQGGQAKARLTHYVTLTNLLPGRTYFYRIVSGNATFPATTEQPLQFTTLASGVTKVAPPTTTYGEVSNTDEASKDTIIYATLDNDGQKSTPVSTIVTDTRTWFVDLTNALDNDRSGYFTVNNNTKIAILGQAGNKGAKVDTNVEFIKSNPLVLNLEENYPVAQHLGNSVVTDPGGGSGVTGTPTGSVTATPSTTPSGPLTQDVPLVAARLVSGGDEEVDLPVNFDQALISNLTDTSVTIVLAAKKAFAARVCNDDACRRDDSAELNEEPELRIHHITVSGLTPASNTSLTIENFSEKELSVTTAATSAAPPTPLNISGTITGGSGRCIVLLQLSRGTARSGTVSRLADDSLEWQANLGAVRTEAASDLFKPADTDALVAQAQCISGGEVYTGQKQTTVQEATANKTNISVRKTVDSDLISSNNNIYSVSILDNDFGVGGGGGLPEASWSPAAVWLLSLGLVMVAVGSGLVGLYLHHSARNRWEEEVLEKHLR